MSITILSSLTVTDVFAANRLLKSPIGITSHRHNRERWGIALKRNGKTIYSVGSRTILSDASHPVILPKGSNYAWKCLEPGECIILEFDANTISTELLEFNISDTAFLVNAFDKIERYLSLQNEQTQLACKQQVYGVLLHLVQSAQKRYHPKAKRESLDAAIQYMASHYYDTAISNEFLAQRCSMSTVYFRKSFQAVFDTSPMRYLQNLRLEKAKAMLESDFESITQIAESVGYRSIYHFSKMFKSHFGLSPTEYLSLKRRTGSTSKT